MNWIRFHLYIIIMNHERLIHDIKKRKDKINMKENKLKGEFSINRVYTKFIETKDGDNHYLKIE